MFRSLNIAIAFALLTTAPAGALELRHGAHAVLELFTSQGCSSCPPADAVLEEFSDHPDTVTLAYHVDYWDYAGWADTFGAPANTARQRAYARSWGSSRIFTPQLVVNGLRSVIGSRRDEVGAAVSAAALKIPVTLASREDDMLEVSAPPQPGLGNATIWLVSFIEHAEISVERGENQGKTLDYSQIVTGRQVVGMWEPETGAHLKLPVSELLAGSADGGVILVQSERGGLPGPVLGAASFTK